MLTRYDSIVVPEMNLGQLAFLLQGRFARQVHPVTKVSGLPFGAAELAERLRPYMTGSPKIGAAQ
jgi:2-oxoglutarate ferredoxin oxidoreductase subunit alpha